MGPAAFILAVLCGSPARGAWLVEAEGRTASLRTDEVDGVELVALDDVVQFFQLDVVRDGRKDLTLRLPQGAIRVRAGRGLVLVNDQPVLLDSEVRQKGGEFYVPVGFVTRALSRALGVQARVDEVGRKIRFDTPSTSVTCERFEDRTRITIATIKPAEFTPVVRDGARRILTLTNQELPARSGGCLFDETVTDLQLEPSAGQTRLTFTVGPRFASLKVYELADAHALVFDFLNDAATSADGRPAEPLPPVATPADVFDTVLVDPGHGGEDLGATGRGGLREKDVTLAIARDLAQLLRERAHLNVILTRDGDEAKSLDERAALANQSRADLFISIHANATVGGAARGAETYFLHADATDESARTLAAMENDATGLRGQGGGGDDLEVLLWDMAQQQYLEESSALASAVQRQMNDLCGTRDRGVKQANFLVLRGATMPAVLVEVGFLSSPREEERLRTPDFQQAAAEALYRAVIAFRDERQARQPR